MTRTRQFKLRGKSHRFDILGIGWNKQHLREAAEAIRSSGYYARVVPTMFDKDMQARRYAIFVRPKSAPSSDAWNTQTSASTGNFSLNRKAIRAITQSPARRMNHAFFLPENTTPPSNPRTWVFNRSKEEAAEDRARWAEWESAIAAGEVTKLDYEMAKKLKMNLKKFVEMRDYGNADEIEDYNEGFGIEPDVTWWENEGYWRDPLEKYTAGNISDLTERSTAAKADRTAGFTKSSVASRATEDIEGDPYRTNMEGEEVDPEDEYAMDPYSELMDSIGYNDSAYRGLSPSVMMGYDGQGGRILGEKEYEGFLESAEEYKAASRRNAEIFFSGSGRFGDFSKFTDRLGTPESAEIIALPLITIKWMDNKSDSLAPTKASIDGHSQDKMPFGVNDVSHWWLHPKVNDTLFKAAKAGEMEHAAELSMLEHVYQGGYGSPIFTDIVRESEEMIEERIEESILNWEMSGMEKSEYPDVMVVGTDIGFFDNHGAIKGIRMTPYSEEDIMGDDYYDENGVSFGSTEKFPPYMRSLFPDNEHWNQAAVSQVWWRGNKVWGGTAVDAGDASSTARASYRDDNLDWVVNDLQHTLTPAEISGIYFHNANHITKSEAEAYLLLHAKGSEHQGGPDDRLLDDDEFLAEVQDRVVMKKADYAKKYGVDQYSLHSIPD